MHETHTIGPVRLAGVSERDFRCYPLRGDSLARYSQLYARRLGRMPEIPQDQAALLAAERAGATTTRPVDPDVRVTVRSRVSAALLYRLPGRSHSALHTPFSALLDSNEPPLFKHFLRVAATKRSLEIACHAATGRTADARCPPLEDLLVATKRGNTWAWEVELP